MTRKFETEVNFTVPWGNKLENPSFFTSRGQDKLYRVGKIYPVILLSGLLQQRKKYGLHRCFRIEFKRICDYAVAEIVADIGDTLNLNPRQRFYEIMKALYKDKSWWDGEYTVLQQVYLEKIGL